MSELQVICHCENPDVITETIIRVRAKSILEDILRWKEERAGLPPGPAGDQNRGLVEQIEGINR